MKIETKYNPDDIVYFLSADPNCIDQNNNDHYLKTDEVFVVKGKIGQIHVRGNFDNKYEVEYDVYIRALGGVKQIRICEEMLAPDLVQLGQNVSNRFYVSGKNQEIL